MTTSVVGLRIAYEFRDRPDGDAEDITVMLRGVAPGGQLGGYRTAQDLPEEYRRALLKWLQEIDQ
jgi:hypothetical protein